MTTSHNKRELTYAEALHEATFQKMAHDSNVFVYGLGVDDPLGIYGTTKDLHKQFGKSRCFDTPLSEDAMTGLGIGAALAGMRPIHVHQRMDFLLLCMNQLVNIAAKSGYMYAGQVRVPFVTRAVVGRSWGQGAQHSQAIHSLFMHIPGLRVVAPTTPYDAKGALVAAIEDDNPVIFMEHRMLCKNKGHVPEELYRTTIGKSRLLKNGADITIVAVSHMVVEALRAANHLKALGINASVIDPIWLEPLDTEAIFENLAKTKRLLVVDHAWLNCGFSAELICRAVEHFGGGIAAKRVGFASTPCPTTKCLELEFYPDSQKITEMAFQMVAGHQMDAQIEYEEQPEIAEFKGPF
jgi:pyruvate/2-oxoglutarate/acetoin dehydrogenase E1 component